MNEPQSIGKHRQAIRDVVSYLRAKAVEIEQSAGALGGGGGAPAPEPCQAYPPGATKAQKLCMDQACALYLIRWIGCGSKPDPAACRDIVHAEYLDDVAHCFPE